MRILLSALLIAAVSCAQAGVARGETYPSRQVTIVVPYPSGTNADVIARLLADKLSRAFNQTVVVESKSGGATVPGTLAVVKAPLDGHTLLQSGTATNINPLLGVKTPYDADRDLAPVVLLVTFPGVLVTHASVPAKTVSELIALTKAKPNALLYGSPGTGSFPHLAMEQFSQLTGSRLAHVPFRGLGPTMIGLLRSDVQVMVSDIPGALDHIQSGELRALAQTGQNRMPQLPDLPTMAEAGVQGYEAAGFLGVWVRTGTSDAAVAVLNRAINQALASPEISGYVAKSGLSMGGGTAAEFAAYLARDRTIWSRVIANAGIKVE